MRPMEQLSVVFNLLHPPYPDLVESMDMTAPCSHQVCKQILQTYIKGEAPLLIGKQKKGNREENLHITK